MKCRRILGVLMPKTFGHDWKNSGLFKAGIGRDVEEQCAKCLDYRHSFTGGPYDVDSWLPGRHPASKPKPIVREKPQSDTTLAIFDELKKQSG